MNNVSSSTHTQDKKQISLIRQFLILAVIGISLFLIQREFSIWQGKRAVSNSGMPSLTINKALTLAEIDNKPLMVNFSAYWCGYCRAFERGSLADLDVQTAIQQRFHYVRLEQTKPEDRKWFDHYKIFGFPTVLIVSPSGEIIDQIVALREPNEFLNQLRQQDKVLPPSSSYKNI